MTDNQRTGENYLLKIREKANQYRKLLMEIEPLKCAARGQGAIRYDKDKVQTSASNRMEEFITDALLKSAEAEEISAELDELKVNSYRIIRKMSNADERIFLEWYYINDLPMEETIKRIHVSERKAYYIRDDALEHFGELLTL